MSHTRVKTTYSQEGPFASTDTSTLYCDHNHSTDRVTFYDEDGSITTMQFDEWESGNDLWDAVLRLMMPYNGEWGKELKDGIEYHYGNWPWEKEPYKGGVVSVEDVTDVFEKNQTQPDGSIKTVIAIHTQNGRYVSKEYETFKKKHEQNYEQDKKGKY